MNLKGIAKLFEKYHHTVTGAQFVQMIRKQVDQNNSDEYQRTVSREFRARRRQQLEEKS